MDWWQSLVVAMSAIIVTKGIDLLAGRITHRREFDKFRKQRIYEDIEGLRDKVGVMYELASNWDSYEHKRRAYDVLLVDRDSLVGKYNKYPPIARAARDVVHSCTLVAGAEREHEDVDKRKTELHAYHKKFTDQCESFLKEL